MENTVWLICDLKGNMRNDKWLSEVKIINIISFSLSIIWTVCVVCVSVRALVHFFSLVQRKKKIYFKMNRSTERFVFLKLKIILISSWIYSFWNTHTHALIYIYIYIYTHIYICTHKHNIYILHTLTQIYIFISVCMYRKTHTHTHTYIYIYIYIYI